MIKMSYIPNLLTLSRILASILWLILFYFDFYILCTLLILYSALSDFLDGWISRKINQSTILGEALDPIADKIFLITVLISYVSDARANLILVSLIVIREIFVSGMREILSKYGKSNSLRVTFLAKIKTSLQFLTILLLSFAPIKFSLSLGLSKEIIHYGFLLLLITTIITIYTGYKYVINGIIELKKL